MLYVNYISVKTSKKPLNFFVAFDKIKTQKIKIKTQETSRHTRITNNLGTRTCLG